MTDHKEPTYHGYLRSPQNELLLIGSGSRVFAIAALHNWLERHEVEKWTTVVVSQVVEEVNAAEFAAREFVRHPSIDLLYAKQTPTNPNQASEEQ